MAQRLKRWESPRNEGRNNKGKGGSARQRQLKKRTQMLRQKLKGQGQCEKDSQAKYQAGNIKKERIMILSFFCEQFNGISMTRQPIRDCY